MSRFTFIAFGFLLMMSCTSNNTGEHIANEVDSVELEQEIIKTNPVLSKQLDSDDIKINSDTYLYAIEQMGNDTISDIESYKLKDFTRLKFDQTQFRYYLLRKLNFLESLDSYLIAEYYETEESCWLVNYDKNKNIISSLEIFYDNAEGAWGTSTVINEYQKTLLVTSYDAYADPSQVKQLFIIDHDGKIVAENIK